MAYVIALIGARSGSRGVINKNIRMLGSHPLLAYSIKAAQKAANINRVVVSTDSEEYGYMAKNYGAEVIIQPPDTAQDDSGDYPFINNFLCSEEYNKHPLPNLIVHLRPTTPLREPSVMLSAVSFMLHSISANCEYTALRSVHEMSESAYKCFEIEHDILKSVGTKSRWLDYVNMPRQQYTTTYQGNGYVDVLRVDFIKTWCKEKRLHGNNVAPFITNRVTEVDTEDDFARLEYEVLKNPLLVKRLFD